MSDDIEDFKNNMPMTFDDDEVMGGAGTLQGLDAYEKLEVTNKKLILAKQAKNLVQSLISIYFDAELITGQEHIDALAIAEASTLESLLAQSEYANHAVTTLMRKIDAGMHMELGVYDILIKLQNNALDITMKVANYRRTLMPYLKSVKEELSASSMIEVLSRVENDNISGASIDEDGNTYDSAGGKQFRGTKELNKFLMSEMEAARKELEASGFTDMVDVPKPENIPVAETAAHVEKAET